VNAIPAKEESQGEVGLISNFILQEAEAVKVMIRIIIVGTQDIEMIMIIMMVKKKREDTLVTVAKLPDIRREDDIVTETIPN